MRAFNMLTTYRSFLLLLCFFSSFTFADDNYVKTFDNYEVHYSIFNTSFLNPEIAEDYNIVRSGSKALINLAVLEKDAKGQLHNVTAIVSGEQFDLIRKEALSFKEVKEEHAIYYLSTIDIQHRAVIYFTFTIKPSTSNKEYTLELNKELFKDE